MYFEDNIMASLCCVMCQLKAMFKDGVYGVLSVLWRQCLRREVYDM